VFVHPVGGDVLCYAQLAAALGDGQPFYALQVPDTDPPLATVPDLAAHYVEALTSAVPEGPYRIGGWSMGACVALEMAQQLTRAGKEVELVALVDISEPPGTRPDAPVDDAVLLSWFARDLAGLAGISWELPPDVLRAGDRPPLETFCDAARRTGVLPEDVDLDTVHRIVERFSRNFHALLAYDPQPYSGRVLFLRASDGAPPAVAEAWLALFPGDAEIVEVAGDHYTVMGQPRVDAVAHALDTAMHCDDGETLSKEALRDVVIPSPR
jgi:thioesterase domain-containing protein